MTAVPCVLLNIVVLPLFFFGKYLEKKKTISKQGCRDVAMAKGREKKKKNVFACHILRVLVKE